MASQSVLVVEVTLYEHFLLGFLNFVEVCLSLELSIHLSQLLILSLLLLHQVLLSLNLSDVLVNYCLGELRRLLVRH